jgi:hypothetical protein
MVKRGCDKDMVVQPVPTPTFSFLPDVAHASIATFPLLLLLSFPLLLLLFILLLLLYLASQDEKTVNPASRKFPAHSSSLTAAA